MNLFKFFLVRKVQIMYTVLFVIMNVFVYEVFYNPLAILPVFENPHFIRTISCVAIILMILLFSEFSKQAMYGVMIIFLSIIAIILLGFMTLSVHDTLNNAHLMYAVNILAVIFVVFSFVPKYFSKALNHVLNIEVYRFKR
jgi:hypothetical protein